MKKNILILTSAIVISSFWFFFLAHLPIFPACEGLACAGTVVIILFVHFIIIPIIFGISGYVFSKENRFKQAFYSLGISLMVAIVIFLPQFFIARQQEKIRAEQEIQDIKARYEANPGQYKQRPY